MSNSDFAERLKLFRKKKGLSQTELGDLVKVSLATVARWESGERQPRLEEIKKLCEIFDCSETELLNKSDQIKITISYDWNKMKEANIDMFSENFDLVVGANGAIGIKGAGTMSSKEAIDAFLTRVRQYLETGFNAQEELNNKKDKNEL